MKALAKLFSLVKIGIVVGNIFPVIAGFALAGGRSYTLFVQTLAFASLVIACGCILNNCYDADIDRLMERTKNRVLAKRELSTSFALTFGILLGVVAFAVGFYFLNILTVAVGAFGLFTYIVLYTILGKRNTIYGVYIGALAGAVPPVIGYCAVSEVIDGNALYMYCMLMFWQLPHSFAIEIFRMEDYKKANIPTVPAIKGMQQTKISTVFYILLFAGMNIALFQSTNIFHKLLSIIAVLWWFRIAINGFRTKAELDKIWARKVFIASIVNMMVVCLGITVNLL